MLCAFHGVFLFLHFFAFSISDGDVCLRLDTGLHVGFV